MTRVAVRFRLPTHLRSSAAAGGRPVRDVRRVLFTCSYVQSPIVHASSIYMYIYIYIVQLQCGQLGPSTMQAQRHMVTYQPHSLLLCTQGL